MVIGSTTSTNPVKKKAEIVIYIKKKQVYCSYTGITYLCIPITIFTILALAA